MLPPNVDVAVKVTESPAQMLLPGLAAIVSNGVTLLSIVMVIALLVSILVEAQSGLVLMMRVMILPLARLELEKIEPFETVVVPFFQIYETEVPGLVIAALKVKDVPAQTVSFGLTLMAAEGVSIGFTIIVSTLLVSEDTVTHCTLLVSTQLI